MAGRLPSVHRQYHARTTNGDISWEVPNSCYYKNFLIQTGVATNKAFIIVQAQIGYTGVWLDIDFAIFPAVGDANVLLEVELSTPPVGGGIRLVTTGNASKIEVQVVMCGAPAIVRRSP